MLSDTTHDGQTGTLECFRGSHRLKAANAQPVGQKQNWPVSLNPRNFPGTEGDAGTDPSQYSENHVVHKAPAGTIISFQVQNKLIQQVVMHSDPTFCLVLRVLVH